MKILALVFKWKVAPPFLLKASFMRGEKEKTFEKRIERLVRKGLLKRISHIGILKFLQLTDAGFLRFKQGLDGFKEEGFASESVWHDFLTSALQLGLWCSAKPDNVEIVSEQEMRRFYQKELPYWLPKIDGHRPDGITRFKNLNQSKVVAFEVEISQKSSDRYGPVFQFYNSNPEIDLVIWLVKNKSLKKMLIENIRHLNDVGQEKHAFILLDEFKTSFWDANVDLGQKSPIKYVELMSQLCQKDVISVSEACRDVGISGFHQMLSRV